MIYQPRPSAGVVVMDDEGRILLIHRADDQTWGLPGGGVEPGESWSQAAVRECREETGWLVRIVGLFGIYSDPRTQIHVYPNGRAVHFFGAVFKGELIELMGEPSDESIEVGFFPLYELPGPIFLADQPIIDGLLSSGESPFIS